MSIDKDRAHAWIEKTKTLMVEHADQLTDLDAAIGDSDHGANMKRGFTAAAELDPADFEDAAAYLKKVGTVLVSKVGGASGPLYGTFFLRFAGALHQADGEADTADFAAAFRAGVDGVAARGKAQTGEATMIDALDPAAAAVEEQSPAVALSEALERAAAAAVSGRDATREMVAAKGRASYLGDRSRGHVDPGAASAALLVTAAEEAWA